MARRAERRPPGRSGRRREDREEGRDLHRGRRRALTPPRDARARSAGPAGNAADATADLRPRLAAAAIVVGAAAGLVGVAFHVAIDFFDAVRASLAGDGIVPGLGALPRLPAPLAAGGIGLAPWSELPGWERLLVIASLVAAMLATARWAVRRFAPEAAGSGVQEIEGWLLRERPLRSGRVLPVKFTGGMLAIGAGFALGREGPTIHMGGAVAQALARLLRCNDTELRSLVAAGAGAGLAAAFNAPLAGILFVAEEMRREVPYRFLGYHAVIVACFAATVVTELLFGVGPQISLAAGAPGLADLPAYVLLGCALGVLGVAFNHALLATLDVVAAWSARSGASLVAALSLGLAALLLAWPDATGGGEAIVEPVTVAASGVGALLALLAVRAGVTLVSYAAGAPGGIFAPMLALGTIAGLAFGAALGGVAPGLGGDPAALAVAGMAGLFAATVRAPLVATALLTELTGSYDLLLAVLLTCAAAGLVAQAAGGRPLYEQLLERTLRLDSRGRGPGADAGR